MGRSGAFVVGLMLLAATVLVAPGAPVRAQSVVVIVVNLDQEVVNLTVEQSTNNDVVLSGEVNITKPLSRLIAVAVALTVTVPSNLTAYLEPPTLTFQDSGSQAFLVHVQVPSNLKNTTQAVVTVEGTATTPQLPTETSHDSAVISFTYPQVDKPNPKPVDNSTGNQDFLPQAMAFCGLSALVGLSIGGVLYWKKRRDQERSTKVIYVPRPPKEGRT